ncbi:MAG TPA: hypothetical protein VG370_05780 [Chloroflexota bacterium]|nr:hypothetical protein [Chloroflexota bacterium]
MDAAAEPPAVLPDREPSHDVGATDAAPDGATEAPAVPRRRLKLVVTLDPSDAAGRALLGVAADGARSRSSAAKEDGRWWRTGAAFRSSDARTQPSTTNRRPSGTTERRSCSGSQSEVEVHHVRRLKDLQRKGR